MIFTKRLREPVMRGEPLGKIYPSLTDAIKRNTSGSDLWVNRSRNEQLLASYAPVRDDKGKVLGAIVLGTAIDEGRLTAISDLTSGQGIALITDVGDKLDPDGRYAYRFVGVARDGNAVTGPNNDQRVSLAPSFRWRPNADTSLTLSATYLQDWGDISSNFLPAQGTVLPNPNGQINQDIYEGDGSFNYYRKKQWSLGYQFEQKLTPAWTFRQNTRLMHLSLDNGSVWGAGFADSALVRRMKGRKDSGHVPVY